MSAAGGYCGMDESGVIEKKNEISIGYLGNNLAD